MELVSSIELPRGALVGSESILTAIFAHSANCAVLLSTTQPRHLHAFVPDLSEHPMVTFLYRSRIRSVSFVWNSDSACGGTVLAVTHDSQVWSAPLELSAISSPTSENRKRSYVEMDFDLSKNAGRKNEGSEEKTDANENARSAPEMQIVAPSPLFKLPGIEAVVPCTIGYLCTTSNSGAVHLYSRSRSTYKRSFFKDKPTLSPSPVLIECALWSRDKALLFPNYYALNSAIYLALFGPDAAAKRAHVLIRGDRKGFVDFCLATKKKKADCRTFDLAALEDEAIVCIQAVRLTCTETCEGGFDALLCVGSKGKLVFLSESDSYLRTRCFDIKMPVSEAVVREKCILYLSQGSVWITRWEFIEVPHRLALCTPTRLHLRIPVMRLQSGAWEEKCWKFFSLDARSVLGYYSLSCSLQQGGHLFLDVDDLAKQVSRSLTRLEAISKEMERALERESRLDERIEELNRTLHLLRPKGHFGCRVSLQFDEHQVRWEDRWILTMWVTTSTESCLSKNWMLVVRVIQGGVSRVYSSSVSPFGSTESSDMAEGKGWMFRWVVYLQSHEPVEVACYLVYHVSEWYPKVSEGDSLNLNEPSGGFDGHVAYLHLGTQEFDLLDWIVCAKKGNSLGALQSGTCTLLPFRQHLCAILSEGGLDTADSGPPGDEYVGSDIRIGTPLVTDGSNLNADLSRIFGRRLDAWTKSSDSACNSASSNSSTTDRSFFLTSGFLQPLSIKIRQETLKLSVSSEELTTSISGRLRVSDVIDIPILALSMFSPRQVSSLLRAAVLQRIAQYYELSDQQLDFPALRLNPPAILSRQYFGEGIQALNATLEGVRVDMLGIGDRLDALLQLQSNPTHPSMADISRISSELQDQIRAAYRTTRAHISDNLIW